MVRRRFLVALVPPDGLSEQLRALRALTGGPSEERIAPHVTLIPPFNVDARLHPEVRAVLRAAATATEPIELSLGPAGSFAPTNATLHLAVGGAREAIEALAALRARVRTGPMSRPDRHGFVPHLTLRRRAPEAMTGAAGDVLCGSVDWTVEGVQLLEQVRGDGPARWVAVAEEPFGGPVVVGRGGVELHLRSVGVVEPLAGAAPIEGADPHPVTGRLVVLAERAGEPGAVVGRAVGSVGAAVARLCSLEVVEASRGAGIARQVLARWCTDAARAGAELAVADTAHPEPLRALGFSGGAGTALIRRLVPR